MISYGCTFAWDDTTYRVEGFSTAEAAMWACFRGMCHSARIRGTYTLRWLRRALPKDRRAQVIRIARGKLMR